jgi:hypothetical protein
MFTQTQERDGKRIRVERDHQGYNVHFSDMHRTARIVPYGSPAVPVRLYTTVWVIGDGTSFSGVVTESPEPGDPLTHQQYVDLAIEAVKEYVSKWEWLYAFNVECEPEVNGTWKVTFNPKAMMSYRGWNGVTPQVPRSAQVIVSTKPKLAVLEFRAPESRFEDKVQADYEAAALARVAERIELEEMMQAAR